MTQIDEHDPFRDFVLPVRPPALGLVVVWAAIGLVMVGVGAIASKAPSVSFVACAIGIFFLAVAAFYGMHVRRLTHRDLVARLTATTYELGPRNGPPDLTLPLDDLQRVVVAVGRTSRVLVECNDARLVPLLPGGCGLERQDLVVLSFALEDRARACRDGLSSRAEARARQAFVLQQRAPLGVALAKKKTGNVHRLDSEADVDDALARGWHVFVPPRTLKLLERSHELLRPLHGVDVQ